jgi:hypothetical protein
MTELVYERVGYTTPEMMAARKAPYASCCVDDDCDLSGGWAHVGPCDPCTCGEEHAIAECPYHDDDPMLLCVCGAWRPSWDPHAEMTTQGGLHIVGAWHCTTCGTFMLGKQSKEAERWRLVAGGRSVDTGITRIRAEKSADPTGLMMRIARLPELEKALRQIAAFDCPDYCKGSGECTACIAKAVLGKEADGHHGE